MQEQRDLLEKGLRCEKPQRKGDTYDRSDYGFESHWIRTSWYDSDGGIQEKNVAEAVQILENGTRKIGRG